MSNDKNKLQDTGLSLSELGKISIPAVDALIGRLLGEKLEEMTSSLSDEQISSLVNKLFGIEKLKQEPMAKAASKKKKRK